MNISVYKPVLNSGEVNYKKPGRSLVLLNAKLVKTESIKTVVMKWFLLKLRSI